MSAFLSSKHILVPKLPIAPPSPPPLSPQDSFEDVAIADEEEKNQKGTLSRKMNKNSQTKKSMSNLKSFLVPVSAESFENLGSERETDDEMLKRMNADILKMTNQIETLQKLTSKSLEENKAWKEKYAKLKELYLKNIDEDFNPEEYFQNEELLKGEFVLQKASTVYLQENQENEVEKEIVDLEKEVERLKEKLEKVKIEYERQSEPQNQIKVLENELEMLRAEENISKKNFDDPKCEQLFKEIEKIKKQNEKMRTTYKPPQPPQILQSKKKIEYKPAVHKKGWVK